LLGLGDPHHVAFTFDDGPDANATPRFLDALDDVEVRATFFVLGGKVAQQGAGTTRSNQDRCTPRHISRPRADISTP
jgi:peptidoglycan/xylan/chitin deacetylase (PgdA/CDA1 family)